MNDRLPRVFLVKLAVRAVQVVPVSAAIFSHTRLLPTMMWLHRAPAHSALPRAPGLPRKRSNGSTNDCVSLRIVAFLRSPPNTPPVFAQFATQRWSAPLL